MDWISAPAIWTALLTLTALEIVLGIDNIVFISILTNKLPANQQENGRLVGLGAAMLMRIILLNRPPVSNLYETFLFVAWVSALVGLIMERIGKNGLGIIVSGICGFVFMLISAKFAMEGDTESAVWPTVARGRLQ